MATIPRLPEDLMRELERLAAQTGRTIGDVMAEALRTGRVPEKSPVERTPAEPPRDTTTGGDDVA